MLIFRPLLRFADFSGRARRAEYWSFMGLQFLIYLACFVMIAGAFGSIRHDPSGAFMSILLWVGIMTVVLVLFALPNYAVLARRLHDIGKSAIWMALLLPGIVAQATTFSSITRMVRLAASGGAMTEAEATHAAVAAAGGSALVSIIAMVCQLVLFIMTVLPGQTGPNRFGPDPKNPDAVSPEGASGLKGYDEARVDELIAQARREQFVDRDDRPYRPVFDFSPGATGPMRNDIPADAWNPAPDAAWADGGTDTPVRDATPPRAEPIAWSPPPMVGGPPDLSAPRPFGRRRS